MSEQAPAYITAQPATKGEIRDWLQARLANGVPDPPDPLRLFIDALDWRPRAVVVMCYADHLTQEEVAYRLGITRQTVYTDLCRVLTLMEGAGK